MPAAPHSDPVPALLEQHRGILFKVANAYCPRAEDRDDLVQEISLQVWRAHPRFDGRCKVSTWIYRIALNVAISFHRAQEPHRLPLSGDDHLRDLPAPEAPASADVQTLHRFIQTLGGLDRGLILLYLDERSHAEIAETLGLSASNVATRIGRIKDRLRQTFAS